MMIFQGRAAAVFGPLNNYVGLGKNILKYEKLNGLQNSSAVWKWVHPWAPGNDGAATPDWQKSRKPNFSVF
jgi:hypothetical protein